MDDFDVQINFDINRMMSNLTKILDDKLMDGISDSCQRQIAELYKEAVEIYVPMKTGKLRDSATVTPNTTSKKGGKYAVQYSAWRIGRRSIFNYAYWQYHTVYVRDRTTPNTFDHWNRHLSKARRQNFYQKAARVIISGMNNG